MLCDLSGVYIFTYTYIYILLSPIINLYSNKVNVLDNKL